MRCWSGLARMGGTVPAVAMKVSSTVVTIVPLQFRLRGAAARFVVAALLILLTPRLSMAACSPVAVAPLVWRAAAENPTVRISFLGHASFLTKVDLSGQSDALG